MIADDVVVAVLDCRVLIVDKCSGVYMVMGPPYKPMNYIGPIYSGYLCLSLRWYLIRQQYFCFWGFVILCILTFFKALISNIFANYVSCLKKTWLTEWFEQRSLEENFYEASALPSEPAGPG